MCQFSVVLFCFFPSLSCSGSSDCVGDLVEMTPNAINPGQLPTLETANQIFDAICGVMVKHNLSWANVVGASADGCNATQAASNWQVSLEILS